MLESKKKSMHDLTVPRTRGEEDGGCGAAEEGVVEKGEGHGSLLLARIGGPLVFCGFLLVGGRRRRASQVAPSWGWIS